MYPENNGEMVSKLYLGSERITETDPIYASSGYPKNVNNWKQIQHLDIHPEREIVYPKNNREMMPKLYLGLEWTI